MDNKARIVEPNLLNLREVISCFNYFYQPQYSLLSSELKGYECLLRLNHPSLGLLAPADFLPGLKKDGLWDDLWPELLKKVSVEQQRHSGALRLAINVSPEELEQGEHSVFLSSFYSMSKSGLIDASSIEIEITEEVQIQDYQQVNASIYMLEHLGASVVIDDFGAGYSNMSALDRLDVRGIKIDRGLIDGIESSEMKQAIVKSFVDIAKLKGCYTLAEGIETEQQKLVAKSLGCQFGQGFLLGLPGPTLLHRISF